MPSYQPQTYIEWERIQTKENIANGMGLIAAFFQGENEGRDEDLSESKLRILIAQAMDKLLQICGLKGGGFSQGRYPVHLGLSEQAIAIVKKWHDTGSVKRVRSDTGGLGVDENWSIELLDFFINITDYAHKVKVYYFIRVEFPSDGGGASVHKACLARTGSTGAPNEDKVIMIVEGSNDTEDIGFFGTRLFTMQDGYSAPEWTLVDWRNLPELKDRAQYDQEYHVPYDDLIFTEVPHCGSCGYIAIAIALKLPSWKVVFGRLVNKGCFGDDDVVLGDGDFLTQDYWATSAILRVLALEYKIHIVVLKDDTSFKGYSVVDVAFGSNGSKHQNIVALHIRGVSFNALLLTETGRERLQEISSVAFEKAMSQDKMLFLDIHDSQKSDNEDSVHSPSHTIINISERDSDSDSSGDSSHDDNDSIDEATAAVHVDTVQDLQKGEGEVEDLYDSDVGSHSDQKDCACSLDRCKFPIESDILLSPFKCATCRRCIGEVCLTPLEIEKPGDIRCGFCIRKALARSADVSSVTTKSSKITQSSSESSRSSRSIQDIPNALRREANLCGGKYTMHNVLILKGTEILAMHTVDIKGYTRGRYLFVCVIKEKNIKCVKYIVFDTVEGTLHHTFYSNFRVPISQDEPLQEIVHAAENALTLLMSSISKQYRVPHFPPFSKASTSTTLEDVSNGSPASGETGISRNLRPKRAATAVQSSSQTAKKKPNTQHTPTRVNSKAAKKPRARRVTRRVADVGADDDGEKENDVSPTPDLAQSYRTRSESLASRTLPDIHDETRRHVGAVQQDSALATADASNVLMSLVSEMRDALRVVVSAQTASPPPPVPVVSTSTPPTRTIEPLLADNQFTVPHLPSAAWYHPTHNPRGYIPPHLNSVQLSQQDIDSAHEREERLMMLLMMQYQQQNMYWAMNGFRK